MARLQITPLDPNSDKGREVAERLTDVLAEIRVAVKERRRLAALRQRNTERGAA